MYLSMNLELSFITSTTLNTYYFEKKSDVAYWLKNDDSVHFWNETFKFYRIAILAILLYK